MSRVHHTLGKVGERVPEALEPAMPIMKSVKPGYIVCLKDEKKFMLLKQQLETAFHQSSKEYQPK